MKRQAIAEALRDANTEEMDRDQTVFCIGKDIAVPGGWGGAFTVTLGLEKKFPDRMINTPIAELGFFGVAVGATGRGSQHAQNMERYFTGVPGLKVVAVSNAFDAKEVLKAAVRDDNPVLIFEHKLLYGSKGARVEAGAVDATSEIPDRDYVVPLDQAALRRPGSDVTILSWLLMLHFSLDAAQQLANDGIAAEVVDVRSLAPIDYQTIGDSVKKTGHLVIVEEGPKTGWACAEIAAGIQERFGQYLKAPVARVASPDVPVPFSPILENAYRPSPAQIRLAAGGLFGKR